MSSQSSIEASSLISFYPESLDFTDYEPMDQMKRTLKITNRSTKSFKIFLEPPKIPYITLHHPNFDIHKPIFMAPGVDIGIEVHFSAPPRSKKASLLKESQTVKNFLSSGKSDSFTSDSGDEDIGKNFADQGRGTSKLDPCDRTYLENLSIMFISHKTVLKIPISASPIKASLKFPSLIDFGTMVWMKTENDIAQCNIQKKTISFSNDSARACFVKIISSNAAVTLSPSSFFLEGSKIMTVVENESNMAQNMASEVKIDVCLNGDQVRGSLEIPLEAQIFTIRQLCQGDQPFVANDKVVKSIKIITQVHEQKLKIKTPRTTEPTTLATVDFGEIYFGESSKVAVTLFNDGPLPVRCSLTPLISDTKKYELTEGCIHFENETLELSPNSEQSICLLFKPLSPPDNTGFRNKLTTAPSEEFAKDFTVKTLYHIPKQENIIILPNATALASKDAKVKLSARGTAHPMEVSISPLELDFGNCNPQSEKELSLRFKNTSTRLGAWIHYKPLANFQILENSPFYMDPESFGDLTIKFVPNQLGPMNTTLLFQIKQGKKSEIASLRSIPISLIGESKPLAPPIKFNHKHHFYYKDPIYDSHSSIVSLSKPNHEQVLERMSLDKNRRSYVDYIRSTRSKRIAQERSKIVNNDLSFKESDLLRLDEIDNSEFDPINGLVAPQLNVEEFIKDFGLSQGNAGSTGSLTNQLESMDFVSSNKTDFSKTPKLLNQLGPVHSSSTIPPKALQDIQKPITAHDLSKVYPISSQLDFGTLILNSVGKGFINFYNGSHNFVKFSLSPPSSSKFKVEPRPQYQIVPRKSAVGFEVNFIGTASGSFHEVLIYTMNDRHSYPINISGHVVPITLDVSTREIRFEDLVGKLHKGDISFRNQLQEQQNLVISNPHGQTANFCFSQTLNQSYAEAVHMAKNENVNLDAFEATHPFYFEPRIGSIEPHGTFTVKVKFTPTTKQKYEETWTLLVENGDSVSISCHASLFPTTCVVSSKDMEFGMVPVIGKDIHLFQKWNMGTNAFEKIIKLRNTGTVDTFFYIPKLDENSAYIQPTEGYIAAGASVDLNCRVLPSKAGKFHETTQIYYLGTKGLRLGVSFMGVQPFIVISASNLKFQDPIFVGNEAKRYFNLLNPEPVQAQLILDLSEYPDFKIECPSPFSSKIPIVQELTLANSDIGPDRYDSDETLQLSKVFSIVVPPKESVEMALIFNPKDSIKETYNFDLPIKLLGSSEIQWHSDASPKVSSFSKPAPLAISKDCIQFKNQVVYISDNELMHKVLGWNESNKLNEQIVICNQWNESITWRVNLINIINDSNAFKTNLNFGTLESGKEQLIMFSFQPSKLGLIKGTAIIEALWNNEIVSKYSITLEGLGVKPSLVFDPPELYLPIVPLGVDSIGCFSIVNYGCHRGDIKFTAPADASQIQLETLFPQGRRLKSDGERLLVFIKCSSNLSTSFCTSLEFETQDKLTFRIMIYGTFDNSIMTAWNFMNMTRRKNTAQMITQSELELEDGFGIPKSETLVTSKSKLEKYTYYYTTPGGIELSHATSCLHSNQLVSCLINWFTDVIVLNMSVSSIPGSFIQSNGKMVFELIQVLGGKKNIPITYKSPPQQGDERLFHLERQYTNLLNYLRSRGAHLSSVKPEFLFSKQDFKKWNVLKLTSIRENSSSHISDENVAYLQTQEKHFDVISKESWISMILQIFKVFLVERINLRQLKALHDDNADLTSEIFNGSSNSRIYSNSEVLLMKWVTFNFNKLTKKYPKIQNFESSFRNGALIAAMLQSFIPNISKSDFIDFDYDATSEARIKKNSEIISNLIQSHLPGFRISSERLFNPFAYDTMLLITYLFLVLPEFRPKADIIFKGKLHEKMLKYIEINNPTNKPITYLIQLVGAPEYSVKDVTINVPAKGESKCAIEYFSRFSRVAKAQLILRSSKMTLETSSVLVFNLESDVEKPVPKEIYQMEAPMYVNPPTNINMEIKNPFPMRGKFTITLKNYRWVQSNSFTKQKSSKRSLAGDLNASPSLTLEEVTIGSDKIPPAFRIPYQEIILESDATAKFPVQFVPFSADEYEASLYFIDENVGEFLYQLKGKGLLPNVSETFTYTSKSNSRIEKALRVPIVNLQREKALFSFISNVSKSKLKKDRDSVNTLKSLYEIPVNEQLKYKGPTEVFVQGPSLNAYVENQSTFEIPIVFDPKLPGRYSCNVHLTCSSAEEIRIYRLEGVAMAEGNKADLEMVSPARKKLLQEIPIVNKSNDPWNIRAFFQGSTAFSGPVSIQAKAAQITYYPLQFYPTFKGEQSAILTLNNTSTNQNFLYTLKGLGEEPLAEDTFTIQCIARQQVNKLLRIENNSDVDEEYDIVSGLPNILSKPYVKVPPRKWIDYKLMFQPNCGGNYKESVSLISRTTGDRLWYMFDVIVSPPSIEDTIKISTPLRTPVALELKITNPADVEITYSVDFNDEELSGAREIKIAAHDEKLYQLIFSPLRGAGSRKTSITFRNEVIAEFKYDLILEAQEIKPTILKSMACPLGRYCTQKFYLENPLNEACTVTVTATNTDGLYILNQSQYSLKAILDEPNTHDTVFHLPSMSRKTLYLAYWPCTCNKWEDVKLLFQGPKWGVLEFRLQTQGKPPIPFETTLIKCPLEAIQQTRINFSNPFKEAINITYSLVMAEPKSPNYLTFAASSKKGREKVPAKSTIPINIQFNPKKMKQLQAYLIVETSDHLKWQYPITATTFVYVEDGKKQSLEKAKDLLLETKVGDRCSKIVTLPLIASVYSFTEQELMDQAYLMDNYLDRFLYYLRFTNGTKEERLESRPDTHIMVKRVNFTSNDIVFDFEMKNEHAELIVEEIDGGEWRVPIQIIANAQNYDQTVIINFASSTIDKANVKFQKTNPSDRDLTFDAYFSSNSPLGFSVSPRSGILKSHFTMSDADNWFTVNYFGEGGRNVMGYLIIKTSDGKTSTLQVRTGGSDLGGIDYNLINNGSIMQSRLLDHRDYGNFRPSSSPGSGQGYKRVTPAINSIMEQTSMSSKSPKTPRTPRSPNRDARANRLVAEPEVYSPRLPSLKPRSMLKLNNDPSIGIDSSAKINLPSLYN